MANETKQPVTLTVTLEPELYRKLQHEANRTYSSKASVLRRLVGELPLIRPENNEEMEEDLEPESAKEQGSALGKLFSGWGKKDAS
jgi:hypothetical protein